MKTTMSYIALLLLLHFCYKGHCAVADSSAVLSIDPPYAHEKLLYQQLNYELPYAANANIRIRYCQNRQADTIVLYDVLFEDVPLKKGVSYHIFNLEKNTKLQEANYSFWGTIKRFELIPPGDYTCYLYVDMPDSNITLKEKYTWHVDSILSYQSGLRKEINNALSANPAALAKQAYGKAIPDKPAMVKQDEVKRINQKLSKKVASSNGLISKSVIKDSKNYTAIYYKEWCLGFYQIEDKKSMAERILTENKIAQTDPSAIVSNNVENATSVSSQFKKLGKKSKKEKPLSGSIDLAGNFSNGQEPGSMQDNNYQEIRGDIQTEISGIPVAIEGYYTTQDNNRRAKSSYFRIRYDVEQAKSELNKTVNSYKSKFQDAKSKGGEAEYLSNQLIEQLKQQQALIIAALFKEYGIREDVLRKYNDPDQLAGAIDTSTVAPRSLRQKTNDSDVIAAKQKIQKNKDDIKKKYEKIADAQKKIDRYQKLIKQYNKQQYLDSALSYGKIDKYSSEDVSYKKLSKAAQHILPEGRVSSFLAGLTKLEVGILNAYESNYTMAGQTLKGGSVGYDLGFVRVSAAAGKTEYISRDGEIDKYNTYMGRFDFDVAKQQKFGLIYYGSSPTRQILSDNNFFKSDAGIPSFQQPTHVLSLIYDGVIAKDVSVQTEAATSYKRSERPLKLDGDNTAIKAAVVYNMSFAPANLKAEWEHMGKLFENNTLPYNRIATERYTLASQATVFGSFLTLCVQFNYLKQETFSSAGYNTKWGFDVKTNSKRYPSVLISYKPFTTFRRFDDTLAVPQRPVTGAVWIVRSSYQLKRKNASHRFMITYNQNNSIMDTQSYNGKTLQLGYIYTTRMLIVCNSAGWSSQSAFAEGESDMSNYFINVSVDRKLSPSVSVNIGQDVAYAAFGLQRIATTAGTAYTFKKLPVSLRAQVRYSSFKQNELTASKQIWMGQLGINWRFRTKSAI